MKHLAPSFTCFPELFNMELFDFYFFRLTAFQIVHTEDLFFHHNENYVNKEIGNYKHMAYHPMCQHTKQQMQPARGSALPGTLRMDAPGRAHHTVSHITHYETKPLLLRTKSLSRLPK